MLLKHRPLAVKGPPKWYQVADIIRDAIRQGDYLPGSILPTEVELTRTFGISRTTIRSALSKLVSEGLIIRRPGVGSVVIAERFDRPTSQIRGFSEDMRSRGLEPGFEVLEVGWSEATGEVAQALAIASTDRAFRSARLLKANGRIIGHSESWVTPNIFGSSPPPDISQLAAGSLYDWLATEMGVEITGGVEFIEAQLAAEAIAARLEVAPRSAVLVATRVAKTSAGLAVEYATITYRSDRYRFRIDL